MSDDDISIGSDVDEINDLSPTQPYKSTRDLGARRTSHRLVNTSSPFMEDDDTTATSHTDPTSNIQDIDSKMNQSQAIQFQAHMLDEQKKSAQVTRERKKFKAYKNTVLYMMKNLKRPDGMDDDKWYEAVERQAKAVIDAIDSDAQCNAKDDDDEGEEWYIAVEKRAREVIEEVGRKDIVRGDTEWGQGEWNDVVERKVKSQIDEKKKEELNKLLKKEKKEKRARKKKMEEQRMQEEKENKERERKRRSDEKYKMPIVPLANDLRSPLCKLKSYPKFEHSVTKDAATLRRESQDENRSTMRQYKRTRWIMEMAEWKRRRAEWKKKGWEWCGCQDCKKDLESLPVQ